MRLGRFEAIPLSETGVWKAEIELGGQVILPHTLLAIINSREDVDYPLMFKVRNPVNGKVSHCGVLEFTAEEGTIYLPLGFYENLELDDDDILEVSLVSIPMGKMVKLQPQKKEFLDITDHKAVLEHSLKRFYCITADDTLNIHYNRKTYKVNILEIEPENEHHAIKILNCDLNVEFAPPLDYVEPEKKNGSTTHEELEQMQEYLSKEHYYLPVEGRVGVPNVYFEYKRIHFCRQFRKTVLPETVIYETTSSGNNNNNNNSHGNSNGKTNQSPPKPAARGFKL